MEQVLAVKREVLAPYLKGDVFMTRELPAIMELILKEHLFAPREIAEYDRSLKQIIPYVVIRQKDRYFLLRRLRKQTEARLHDLFSLGVGGHINPIDHGEDCSVVEAGMQRELEEEVLIEKTVGLRCVGILNEDTGGVGDYHLGVVYLLEADGSVSVREKEKMEGTWRTVPELEAQASQMETWSQIVLTHLIRPESL